MGNWDWIVMNGYIEVYYGWKNGNMSMLNLVINLMSVNLKLIVVVGYYLFVGYVYMVLNIDIFDLNIGVFVMMLMNLNLLVMDVGNDVDLMYGVCVYLCLIGEYVIMKDNYNGLSIVVYCWCL